MPDDTHQLAMLQAELAEALNDIERYERVARGDYTTEELRDRGDPIHKLAGVYDSYNKVSADLKSLSNRYDLLVRDNSQLRVQLSDALRNAKKVKGGKPEEPVKDSKDDHLMQMFKALKKQPVSSIGSSDRLYFTGSNSGSFAVGNFAPLHVPQAIEDDPLPGDNLADD